MKRVKASLCQLRSSKEIAPSVMLNVAWEHAQVSEIFLEACRDCCGCERLSFTRQADSPRAAGNKLKPAKARSHWKSKAKPSPGPLKEGQEKTKEPTGGTTPILEEASKDGVLTTLQVFEDLPPKKGKKPKGKKQKAAALSNAKKMKKLKKMKKKQEKVVNKRPRKAKWVNAKLRRQAEKAKAAAS